MAGLAERVLAEDARALARLLTYLENGDEIGLQSLDLLFPHTGRAWITGITGPPGGGKSTLVNELIRHYRAQELRVAVIAVDPSSPLTGGATLGDRIRMTEWHQDPGVFIRSMASRQFGGGLAQNSLAVAHAFDAAGFDHVLIETVGTGQDEVAIASLALTTLLVQVPGTGDGVQTLKAGSLEIGDILVVTKADRPEAGELARDLRRLRTLVFNPEQDHDPNAWVAPVIKTSATTGEGIADLAREIDRHRAWLEEHDLVRARRKLIAGTEIATRVESALRRQLLDQARGGDQLEQLVDDVLGRRLTAHRAADRLLGTLLETPGA
jgi:LAO/AO transport system kinase